jgi:SurA N-terminal domain
VSRSRTVKAAVVGLVAVFVTSGCATHPGAAAVVGSERIGTSQVDDVARALCSAQGASQTGQALASRGARQGALSVLINSSLSRQFGASQGVEPDQEQVSAALAGNEQNISTLPADRRAVFRQAVKEYAEGQLMLIDVGRRALRDQGKKNITEQQAVSEGTKLRNRWAAKNADVSVDPRFGKFAKNALLPGSGSLSVAQSQSATDGDSPDPSQGFVAALPATQKCS